MQSYAGFADLVVGSLGVSGDVFGDGDLEHHGLGTPHPDRHAAAPKSCPRNLTVREVVKCSAASTGSRAGSGRSGQAIEARGHLLSEQDAIERLYL